MIPTTILVRPVLPKRELIQGLVEFRGEAWWWLPIWHPDVPLAVAWEIARRASAAERTGTVAGHTPQQEEVLRLRTTFVAPPDHVQAFERKRRMVSEDHPEVLAWMGLDAVRVAQLAAAEAWQWLVIVWAEDEDQVGKVPVAWALRDAQGHYVADRRDSAAVPLLTSDPREADLWVSRDEAQRQARTGQKPVPMFGMPYDPPQALYAVAPVKIESPEPTDAIIEWRVEVRGLGLQIVPRLREGPHQPQPIWSVTRAALGYSPRDEGLPVEITPQTAQGYWEWDLGLEMTESIALVDGDLESRVLRLDAVLRACGYRTVYHRQNEDEDEDEDAITARGRAKSSDGLDGRKAP